MDLISIIFQAPVISFEFGKLLTNSILATKKQGHGRPCLPPKGSWLIDFRIVDEVGFRQDACYRDRIQGQMNEMTILLCL
jgi:hypothetical protein